MMRLYDIFVDRAIKNPQAAFTDPEEVLENPWLIPSDKRRILKSWEMDQIASMHAFGAIERKKPFAPATVLYKRIKRAEEVLG